MLPSHEPPSADPHARWCGEGGLDTRLYPIMRLSLPSTETLIKRHASPIVSNLPYDTRLGLIVKVNRISITPDNSVAIETKWINP